MGRHSLWISGAAIVLFNLAFTAWLVVRPAPGATISLIDDVAGVAGPLLALLLSGIPRRPWSSILLRLGVTSYAIGAAIYAYYDQSGAAAPYPSRAEMAFLCIYPFMLAGILILPRRPLPAPALLRVTLDGLMTLTAVGTFSWYFVIGPALLQSRETLLAKTVSVAYPAGDLLLVVCLLLLLRGGIQRTVAAALGLGLVFCVWADTTNTYEMVHNIQSVGELSNVGYSFGLMSIVFAAQALVVLPNSTQRRTDALTTRALTWPTLLPYALVPAVGILVIYTQAMSGQRPLREGVLIGAGILVTLVFARQYVAMRELHTMYINNDALNRANGQLAAANLKLEALATTDPLTGLANRTLLREHVERMLADVDDATFALLLMDLDRFKDINDTLGHGIGDILLQRIGPRLMSAVRENDIVARLGGDEFAILLHDADGKGAARAADGLLSVLATPFDVEGHRVDVGASIGIALAPEHSADATTLLRQADVAMYTAKKNRTGYALYTVEQDLHTPHHLALMGELRQAIAEDGLVLYYQPQATVTSGAIQRVEALVRWPHPTRGMVAPDEFISLAEHAGMILPLTTWVLDRALENVARWDREGITLGVAVNLSTHTLHDADLRRLVEETLRRHGVAPERLTLEVTESALLLDPAGAREALRWLRALGTHVSIDDFGTGYSSLGYLRDLPTDEVKIDKSFVLGMAGGSVGTGTLKNSAIVESVIAMAHALGLEVVAEGVETETAWRRLADLGCDTAQGYLLARPLPANDLVRWLRDRDSVTERIGA